jgi:hypothetical protein
MDKAHAIWIGLAALGVLYVIMGVASSFNLKKLVRGADGTLSTSKFQLVLWTIVIVFSYVVMFAFHAKDSKFADLGVPTNVLLVMGISATTAVAAKGIAVSNNTTTNGAANTPPPAAAVVVAPAPPDGVIVAPLQAPVVPPQAANIPPAATGLAGLFQGDSGSPDLGKVQLMIWTIIGIGIYLAKVHYQLNNYTPPTPPAFARTMPDIDQTLMILMGIGHSAYLGKKIVSAPGS